MPLTGRLVSSRLNLPEVAPPHYIVAVKDHGWYPKGPGQNLNPISSVAILCPWRYRLR